MEPQANKKRRENNQQKESVHRVSHLKRQDGKWKVQGKEEKKGKQERWKEKREKRVTKRRKGESDEILKVT